MTYLRFDKTLTSNLQESLTHEMLRGNAIGAYHCTTIVDCNTRKYHGLLVMPVPQIDDENHVLLSSLDETVVQHGAEFNLGLHQYQGGHFSPNGHKYIRSIECEKVPITTYRVGGVILTKEKVFVQEENRILIRYTLVDAHSATTLRLRPYLAFRSVREFTHENDMASQDYKEVENGISCCLYPGYPDLFMQTNKKNEFHYQPDWYRGIEYSKERERGYYFDEDLFVPGYFEVPIKKGETIVFSAGVSEINPRNLKNLFLKEVDIRTPRTSFYKCLKNSAKQFFISEGDNIYLLAGFPWFKCRARDMMIALPGMSLDLDNEQRFHDTMRTAMKAFYAFMAGEEIPVKVYEVDQPDVLLWAIAAVQRYKSCTNYDKACELYGDFCEDVINYILSGKHENLFVHDNGLLWTNGEDKAVSWMNSTTNGRPVVPRNGYLVEINALWYNALRFVAKMQRTRGLEGEAVQLENRAQITATTFMTTFLNEHGYLYDYVDHQQIVWSVRPNMLFAAALDYSPLDKRQRKRVLDFVTRELLTPKGIRSLSPKSDGYNPYYSGPQNERDLAYHQGTAWPWLTAYYMEAYLKVHGLSGVSFVERQLVGLEAEMANHCIGSIPELFDGNPPFKGRGAVSFAMNVGGVLHVLKLLTVYNTEEDTEE